MITTVEILEAVMMLCFGASWPMQIIKTIRVKNPKGKSFLFLSLLLIGYVAGIAGKVIEACCHGRVAPVIYLYILNTLMVSTDIILSVYYLRRLPKTECEKSGEQA